MSDKAIATPERPIVNVAEKDLKAAMQILIYIARSHNQRKLEAGGKLLQAWYWSRERDKGEPTPELDFLHSKSFQRNRIEPKLETFSIDLWNAFQAGRWLQWKILGNAANRHPWFGGFYGITLRSLAAKSWNENPSRQAEFESGELAKTSGDLDDAGNIRKSIWRNRRPVVHMALAAANAIGRAAQERQQPSERLSQLIADWEALAPEVDRAMNDRDGDSPIIAEWNRLSKAVSEERKRNLRQPLALEAIVFDPVWVSPALEQAEEWAKIIESRDLVNGVPLLRFVR